jgi:hypothetical protein
MLISESKTGSLWSLHRRGDIVTFLPDADGYAISTSGFPFIVLAPSPTATQEVCSGKAIEKNRSDDD